MSPAAVGAAGHAILPAVEDTTGSQDQPDARSSLTAIRFDVFAVMWAIAALFHVAGNPPVAWAPVSVTVIATRLLVVAAAGAVLIPRLRALGLVFLSAAIVVSAWCEAPVLGNHWLLAAFVSSAYIAAYLARRRDGAGGIFATFAPVARLCFVVAYAFAAFAKLNSDFFDPAVSCAVYYQDQLVTSWGLPMLSAAGEPRLGLASLRRRLSLNSRWQPS